MGLKKKVDFSPALKTWSLVLRTMDTTKRATVWSVTINNPTKEEVECTLPPGWSLEGQYEKGEDAGTTHFQGLLKTTQVRFSAVKKQFPRAHIEIARNERALKEYVHKEETRVGEFTPIRTPNIFEVQTSICGLWKKADYELIRDRLADVNKKDAILMYVDQLVDGMIKGGARGIEFISINPMWRSSWSRHGHAILARHALPPVETDRQTDTETFLTQDGEVEIPVEPKTGRFAWIDPDDKALEECQTDDNYSECTADQEAAIARIKKDWS